MAYQFYGQFDPPVDQFIFERYFNNAQWEGKEGFFIECGAFDGQTECSCKFFEESLHWKGINVEPGKAIYNKLIQNRPHSININVAISNYIGQHVFRHVIHPHYGELCTNGSLEHTPEHQKALDDMQCEIQEYTVPVTTFRRMVRECGIKRIDLMVLDVEGLELKVIDGMWRSACLPQILCVEYPHVGMDAITQALAVFGYRYDITSHVNAFYILEKPQPPWSYPLRCLLSDLYEKFRVKKNP